MINKKTFLRLLPLLFLGLFLSTPEKSYSAACSVTLNWSGGWCWICGGTVGNYACNPPSCNPCGAWGPRTFADCVPAGNIVTGICADVFFVSCSSAGNFFVALNGTTIGTRPSGGTNCTCYSCENWSTCRTDPCPGGFPGYVYGGTNTFVLDVIPTTSFCLARVVLTITYEPSTPPTPGAISGSTTPCAGSVQTYSIAAVSGASSYSWSVPGGYTINSGQGTTSISVTIGTAAGDICVTSNNGCGSSAPNCLTITPLNPPAVPGAITGSTTPCIGSTMTYNISAVSGASSYTWTVPAGWTINSGQGTTSISVTVGSASGNICVRACNSCGCSAFNCVAVTPTPVPAAPGSITGATSPCAGDVLSYSISAVSGASSYQWTVPAGWTITSGQGTTSITVTAGSTAGNICVRACNGCGCSGFTCKAVTPGATPAVPGPISGPASACPGSSITYSITTVTGATSYTWTVPGGWTINSGQGTTSINVTSGGTGGTITVQACNSCGCSADQSLVVTVSTISITPSAVDESCNGACDGSVSVIVTGGNSPFTYAWDNGCATSSCISLCAGSYNITVTDGGGCTATGSATVLAGTPVLAGFSYNGNQCLAGNSYCFTNSGTTGATYLWDFGDGIGTSTSENPCYSYTISGSYTVTQTVSQGACSDVATFPIVVYDQPTASIASTDVSCNGACDGVANLTVNIGQLPYIFTWSPGGQTTEDISGLCAGTYNVTATDANGCDATASVTITEPVILTASASGNNASCNLACDGDATVIATGGTAPYTYSWDDPGLQTVSNATGLCAGTYNVSVTDANGCIVTTSQIITEPAAMTLVFAPVDATCGLPDGSVCVTPSGGTTPYTYLWDDLGAQTNACATTLFGGGYNVTVTDNNGCSLTGTVTINTSVSVIATITDSGMVSCNGGNDGFATVNANGGITPYSYSWNTSPIQTNSNAVGLPAGTWTATVVDAAGCTDAVTITISEPAVLNSAILSSTDPGCNGGNDGTATVTITGGSGSYTYLWSPNGGVGATGTGLSAGISYTVSITDSLGCNASSNITLSEPSILSTSIIGTNTSCNGGNDGAANLTVSGGTSPYNFLWTNGGISEDISNISAGTYCVTVTDDNGCIDSSACVTIIDPPALSVSTSIIDAYCSLPNGTACGTVSGGTGPFTYSWDDPGAQTDSCATGLLGGITYNVNITDANGCTGTAAAVVNDLPGATVSVVLGNNTSGFSLCDGEATGIMTGGIPPYTYLWNDPLAQTTALADSLCAGNYCVTITDSAGCSSSDCITITEPASITTSIIGTNIDCNGNCNGTADLTVSGGVPPYTFLWTPGGYVTEDVIGLCAGIYYVDVTDNNSITITDSIVITEPNALVISMSGSDAICNGVCDGSASGALSGGTPPYTYLWDDPGAQTNATATELCAGTHTLTVTDTNGCTAINSFIVNEPLAIIISTSTTNATCGQADGSASAIVTNGVGTLTYLWNDPLFQTNPTATGLTSGAYQVVITDSTGCTDSASAAIGDDSGPIATITDSNDVSCFNVCDGDATVSASGGTPPYTYLWNPTGQVTQTAALLCAGTHVAQVTDATGCLTTAIVVIDQPADLVAIASVLTDPNCNGSCDGVATVSVAGGTGPYTYQWDDPATQTTLNATGLCGGSFSVVVTDANGCVAIGLATLVEPLALSLSLSSVDASCNGACDGTASVIVNGGVTPYSYTWSNGDTTQMADSLCANTYVITITDANLCAIISTITVGEPASLIASIFSTQDVSCNGNCDGFATATQSGGTAPYTYSWSDGQITPTAINLCIGSYDITISDANGCSDVTTATIDQPNTITLSINKTDVQCNGNCDGTATVSANGGIPPYTYQWNDPFFQTTPMADSLCDGVFNVTVSDANGCNSSAFVLVIQPNALSILIDSVTESNCGNQDGGACVNIAGGFFPYFSQWSDPNATIGVCINNVFAGVYIVYVIDANGCFDSLPVPINDIGAPIIAGVTTTDDNCYGDSIGTATVDSVTGAVGAITYVWRDLNGDTIAMGIGMSSINNLGGGTYTLSVIDGTTGCITSAVVPINQPSPLNTAIFPIDINNITCSGLCDGSATVTVSGGNAPYSYSWLPTSADITPMADSLCSGSHLVFVTDVDGCIDSSAVTITEPPAISLTASISNVSCFGGNDGAIDLLPTPTGGTPPYAFTWYPPGTAGNTPTATNLTAGTDSVIVVDLKGCTKTLIATVTEPAELIIDTAVTVSDFCGSSQGVATITVVGGTTAYTYSWNTNPSQSNASATGLIAGTYIVTVSDANSCQTIGPVTVPGTPGPIVDSAIVNDVACYGDSTGTAELLVSSGTLPFTYLWNDPNSQTSSIATGLAAGQYLCTVTDANNCQDIGIIDVNQPPDMLVLMFQDDLLICFGDSTQISVVILGGVDPIVRSWDNGLPDTSVHIISPDTTTTYNVFVTDANGCSETNSLTVTVNPPLSISTIGITEVCIGNTVTLTAYPGSGNGGPYTVTWDDGINTTSENVIAGDSSQINVSPAVSTLYTVIVSDGCSLNDTTTAYVVPLELPLVGFYSNQSSGCDITFIDTSKGYTSLTPFPSDTLIASWEWDFGDGTIIGPGAGAITGSLNTSGDYNNPIHNYAVPGLYSVTVTVTDINGCVNSMTISNMITVSPPNANFSYTPNPVTMLNPTVSFTDMTSGNVAVWSWNFGDSASSSNTSSLQNPSHTYDSIGSYTIELAIIDVDGCVDTIIQVIEIGYEPVLYVANIFAPKNNDPLESNILFVNGIGVTSMNFIIYDRWGEKVFETTDATSRERLNDARCCTFGDGWDGTKKGKELSAQVLVYYLEAELENGESIIKKGNITLIK